MQDKSQNSPRKIERETFQKSTFRFTFHDSRFNEMRNVRGGNEKHET